MIPPPNKVTFFNLELSINGTVIQRKITTHLRLLDFIRNEIRLTGTKEVCGEGECGACTVMIDGKTVNSCLVLAVEAHKSEITTIEGLSTSSELTRLQQAFIEAHSVQCGYCIPGMILSGEQILKATSSPSRESIKKGLSGNICRCTGYTKIIDAIENTGDGS